jgi:hypothetical protein
MGGKPRVEPVQVLQSICIHEKPPWECTECEERHAAMRRHAKQAAEAEHLAELPAFPVDELVKEMRASITDIKLLLQLEGNPFKAKVLNRALKATERWIARIEALKGEAKP